MFLWFLTFKTTRLLFRYLITNSRVWGINGLENTSGMLGSVARVIDLTIEAVGFCETSVGIYTTQHVRREICSQSSPWEPEISHSCLFLPTGGCSSRKSGTPPDLNRATAGPSEAPASVISLTHSRLIRTENKNIGIRFLNDHQKLLCSLSELGRPALSQTNGLVVPWNYRPLREVRETLGMRDKFQSLRRHLL